MSSRRRKKPIRQKLKKKRRKLTRHPRKRHLRQLRARLRSNLLSRRRKLYSLIHLRSQKKRRKRRRLPRSTGRDSRRLKRLRLNSLLIRNMRQSCKLYTKRSLISLSSLSSCKSQLYISTRTLPRRRRVHFCSFMSTLEMREKVMMHQLKRRLIGRTDSSPGDRCRPLREPLRASQRERRRFSTPRSCRFWHVYRPR